jgi:hypothetical protein
MDAETKRRGETAGFAVLKGKRVRGGEELHVRSCQGARFGVLTEDENEDENEYDWCELPLSSLTTGN